LSRCRVAFDCEITKSMKSGEQVTPSSDRHRSGRRPGVERSDDPSAPAAPRPAVAPVSSGFSQQVFQNHIVEHGIRQQALQLGVLVLELLQPLCVGQVHPAILGLQLAERRRAQPVLPAKLGGWQACLLLLDHPDDLRLGETAFFSCRLLLLRLGRLYITARELPGGRSPLHQELGHGLIGRQGVVRRTCLAAGRGGPIAFPDDQTIPFPVL
jgi:hypothetical protein